MKLTRTTRNAGWLVVAGLLAAALIAPSGVLANGSNPTNPDECGTTYAYYFKVQAPENGTYQSGDTGVETNWPGQVITISNATNANQSFDWASTKVVLKVAVKYGNEYLPGTIAPNGLSGTVVNGNQNAISHVTWCGNPPTTTTTTTTDETTTTTADETTTTTSSVDTVTTTSVTGTVSGETGKSKPTPPSTDADFISTTSSTTGGGWSLLLIAMAGLLAAALLLTPAAEARKR